MQDEGIELKESAGQIFFTGYYQLLSVSQKRFYLILMASLHFVQNSGQQLCLMEKTSMGRWVNEQ